jgi:hypothetical protein
MPHLEAVNTAPTRADVWNVSNSHCLAHYQMLAEAEPDLLVRVLNLFALQFLTPNRSTCSGWTTCCRSTSSWVV